MGAWVLARAVTPERAPYLGRVLADLLALNAQTSDDEAFKTAVAYWATRVDEIVEPEPGQGVHDQRPGRVVVHPRCRAVGRGDDDGARAGGAARDTRRRGSHADDWW